MTEPVPVEKERRKKERCRMIAIAIISTKTKHHPISMKFGSPYTTAHLELCDSHVTKYENV